MLQERPAKLNQILQKVAHLQSCLSLLSWDEEVKMPQGGSLYRQQQQASLQGVIHEYATSDKMQDALAEALEQTPKTDPIYEQLRLIATDMALQLAYPNTFVIEMAMVTAQSFQAWLQARDAENFTIFNHPLEKLIALKKQEACIINKHTIPYNNLLWLHDRSVDINLLDQIFAGLLPQIGQLVNQFGSKANDNLRLPRFDLDFQASLNQMLLAYCGFKLENARLDESVHPFSISMHPSDTRITTRYLEHDLTEGLFSTLHEMGHAMYEQGLDQSQFGWPKGSFSSLSIHESQSRFWENNIGRSPAFWKGFLPKAKNKFPKHLKSIQLEKWLKSINQIKPNLIRTSADEASYHLHIYIRYKLEKELFAGNLQVSDLPQAWNEAYQQHLGLRPIALKDGVLQDIHWAHGSFGYFPTYTMGSLLAAELYKCMQDNIADFNTNIINGSFEPINNYLSQQVYSFGRLRNTQDLLKILNYNSEKPYLITYLSQKLNILC